LKAPSAQLPERAAEFFAGLMLIHS
jgi:hypothetical protein